MTKDRGLTVFRKEITDRSKIVDALFFSVFFLTICWAFFLSDEFLGYHLKDFGMRPRTLEGLIGIVSMHFLHGDIQHIAQNSLAFLVLNSMLFYFYRSISFRVFLFIAFFASILLWFIGRPANHIGASMIIYGEFSFLFVSGLIRSNPILMRVALVVTFYYGSLIWYIFPIDEKISWEGHLAGLIMGFVAAVVYRRKGPARATYRFESEPEPDENNPYWLTHEQRLVWEKNRPKPIETEESPSSTSITSPHQTTVSVKYTYKEKEDK